MSRHTRRALIGTVGSLTVAGCTGQIGRFGGSNDQEGTPTVTPTSTEGSTESGTESGTETATSTATPSEESPSTQVEDFEDLERWYVMENQGELSAYTDDPYEGSQSARVQATSDHVYGAVFKAFEEPKDFSNRNVSLAVKLGAPEIAKVTVDLLAPDRGNLVRMTRTLTGPTNTWLRIDFGVTDVRRDPDLSKVREIRVIGRRRDGDEPIDLAFDDLRVVDAPDQGGVMLTFDDSHATHYENAFKLMQEYDFPGVEGVIADSIYGTNRLDVGMMREMSDAGWDMASHPRTSGTQLPEFSKAEQRRLIEENKQFLVRKGFRDGARHFLTPQNMRGPDTMELVREHHDTMFSFGGMPNGLPSTTTYNYGRVNATEPQAMARLVDLAAEYNQLLVINHHVIGSDGIPLEDFRTLLDYIDQADVEVVTASDLLDGDLTVQVDPGEES